MPFTMVRGDITKMKVDAIVNAANTSLTMGGGVCGAIFRAAGAPELQAACNKLAPIRTGEAAITPGFALSARYLIHAAGPIYAQWGPDEAEKLLRSAYTESMKLAKQHGCRSIAFPLISGGIYGYPKAGALQAAVSSIRTFLDSCEMDVYLVFYNRSDFTIRKALLDQVDTYLLEHMGKVDRPNPEETHAWMEEGSDEFDLREQGKMVEASQEKAGLEQLFREMDAPFNMTLLHLIDQKGKTDAEVYKRANIDRKLFSKIRDGKGYTPGKRTILALAVALELSLPETDDLLKRAGYALSHSRKFDLIVQYFLLQRDYDIYKINEVLFEYDQPLLGHRTFYRYCR
jgi:O-acetyl-ADP-ribose deacetylase (regulator of RNase III)